MTYNPSIPTGSVALTQDYQNVQNNFSSLNTYFGRDHVQFSDNSSSSGFHKSITMKPQSTPGNKPSFGQLYCTNTTDSFSTTQTLFFKTGSNLITQLTMNLQPLNAANGYTFLPGGILYQWGVVTNPAATGTVTFATSNKPFTSDCYSVMFNFQRTANSTDSFWLSGKPSATSFSWKASTGSANFLYWIAIGN